MAKRSERTCQHCHLPITTGSGYKYHSACAILVNAIKRKEYYQKHRQRYLDTAKAYMTSRPLCTCCGLHPRGEGLRYLCNLCYLADGDSWKADYQDRFKVRREAHGHQSV